MLLFLFRLWLPHFSCNQLSIGTCPLCSWALKSIFQLGFIWAGPCCRLQRWHHWWLHSACRRHWWFPRWWCRVAAADPGIDGAADANGMAEVCWPAALIKILVGVPSIAFLSRFCSSPLSFVMIWSILKMQCSPLLLMYLAFTTSNPERKLLSLTIFLSCGLSKWTQNELHAYPSSSLYNYLLIKWATRKHSQNWRNQHHIM